MQGRPLASAANAAQSPAEFSAGALRDAVLASLNLVPTVGGFLSYIGALFIPAAGKTTDQMWREIIDARISEALFKKVQRDLVGLTDAAGLYRKAVSAGSPNEIRETSISVNTLFTGLVPGFQISGEEISTLPLFAIAATMHLSLLRDMAVKGKDLGLNDASIANYQQELKRRIEAYTLYADKYVAAAIDKARTDNPFTSFPTRNQPLHAMLVTKADLQLSVLDLRETWPSFDAVKFPAATRVELTRELLSPIGGWWDPRSSASNTLPDWKAPTSRLKTLKLWENSQWRTSFLMGASMGYADGSSLDTGKQIGTMIPLPPANLENIVIDSIKGYFSAGMANLIFTTKEGKVTRIGRLPEELEPGFEYKYPGHTLSSLRSVGVGWNAGEDAMTGCIFGFQLVDKGPKPISPQAFEQIAPKIAPRLLDWIAS